MPPKPDPLRDAQGILTRLRDFLGTGAMFIPGKDAECAMLSIEWLLKENKALKAEVARKDTQIERLNIKARDRDWDRKAK